MRKFIYCTLLFVFCTINLTAQEINTIYASDSESKPVYFGVGIGFGLFYPGDVNDYIHEDLEGYYIYSGSEDMYLNFSGRLSVYFKLAQNIDLGVFMEGAWAPKWIYDEADVYYSFTRVSPGIAPKFYIPLGSGRHSFFISPGIMYNTMKFEGYKASNVGGKLQAGVNLKFGPVKLQPYGAINIANAKDDNVMADFNLNYSDFHIGVEFLF